MGDDVFGSSSDGRTKENVALEGRGNGAVSIGTAGWMRVGSWKQVSRGEIASRSQIYPSGWTTREARERSTRSGGGARGGKLWAGKREPPVAALPADATQLLNTTLPIPCLQYANFIHQLSVGGIPLPGSNL